MPAPSAERFLNLECGQLTNCLPKGKPYSSFLRGRCRAGQVKAAREGLASIAWREPFQSQLAEASKGTTQPTGAEAAAETKTGAVDPLSTSSPPKPSNFAGPSGESPTAASKAPAVGSGNPPGYEASKSASTAVDNAAANVKQSAKQAAEAAQGSSGESASRGADALSTATPTPSGSTPGILEESAKSLTDGQPQPGPSPGGSNSLLDSFNDAKSSLQEGGNTLLSSTGDSVQGLTGGLKEQANNLSAGLSKQLDSISGELNKQLAGASDATDNSLQDLGSQLSASQAAATEAASSIAVQLSDSANSALQTLPAPVRDTVLAAARPFGKALSDPRVAYPLLGVLITVRAVGWAADRIGGYAGQLDAPDALRTLEEENSLLLDIRNEDSRERNGTPDLRYAARSRGIAFPLVRISRQSGTQVVKADVLPFQLAAAIVQGLKKVNWRTKIIILDDKGTRPIKLARALNNVGFKAYVLKGGMKSWASSGLLVKESTEYDASSFDGINDTVQGRILPALRDPLLGPLTISLGVTSAAAFYDVHRTLQFVGTFAILANLATIPAGFRTWEEAKEQVFWPFLWAGNLVSKASSLLPKATAATTATPALAEAEGKSSGEQLLAEPVTAEIEEQYVDPQEKESGEESDKESEVSESKV